MPYIPRFMKVKQDTEFDYSCIRKRYTPIKPTNGTSITGLNGGSEIRFSYSGQDKFYRLSDPETGFLVKVAFRTQAGDPLANARNGEITLANDWFGYLFSSVRFNLGSVELENIQNPGVVCEVLNHMKSEDFRTKAGENQGFIPDTDDGTSRSIVSVNNAAVAADAAIAANALCTAVPNENYNAGFARRMKKYNYTLVPGADDAATNAKIRYAEIFVPLSSIFGCCAENKLLKTINFEISLRRKVDDEYTELFFGAANTGAHFRPGDATANTGLVDITLNLVDYVPNPDATVELNKIFSSEKINWTFKKRNCIKVGKTHSNEFTENKTSQEVPQLVLVVAKGTDGDAQQNGAVTRNFGFCRHANMQNVRVNLDGQNYPDQEQNGDFSNGQYSTFYDQFRRACYLFNGSDCAITSSEYRDLYTIFAVDTSIKEFKTPNSTSNMTVSVKRRAVPADNATAVNPQDCEYYIVLLTEKSYNISCLEKLVTVA